MTRTADDVTDTFADVLRDYALRAATAAGSKVNADPLLITQARETAAELLADYLAHCTVNKAARERIRRVVDTRVTDPERR